MKNKFTEKIAKILIAALALCPMLLMSFCYSSSHSSARTVSGAYSGITFGIDSAVSRLEK